MAFRIKATSAARHWTGFEATVYEATAGLSELSFSQHSVSMHLGRPLLVTSRCDGASLRRLQVPGDIKIVPAGVPRVWETQSATTKLSMDVSPALLYSVAQSMGVKNPGTVTIVPQLHVTDARIEHIGWAVKAELESNDAFGRTYAEGLGVALAAQLLRRYARVPEPAPDGALPRRRLERALEYIRAKIANDLSLFELARVAGVSPSHFKTLFKRTVGTAVHQYVIRARVEYAAAMLQRDDAPLVDVALQSGFSSQSHLARCMRRLIGVTPRQVRDG
ncbi:MAG: AraC family transcriptional regulator [Candidatus Tumulicola sp.]